MFMKLLRRLSLSLCLAVATTAAWATPSPADTKIAEGRAALVAHDLTTARTRFTEARALDTNNQTAAALLGITRWLGMVGDSSTTTFLNGLGVAGTGRDLYNWTAEFPKNSDGNQVLPTNYSSQTIFDFIGNDMVPTAVAARGDFAAVTSNSFLLTLSAQETGQTSVTIDRGDILIAQAGLRAFEFFVHFLGGQNLTLNAADLLDLSRGDFLNLPRILRDNPNLLTAGSASERTAARAALVEMISLYRQGSAFVRARPPGLERIFMLEADGLAEEADLRSKLADIERGLVGYVTVGEDGGGAASLAPLFTAGYSLRAQLPDPNQPFNPQTFTGSTFGGALLGMPREQVMAAYVEMGFVADLGWTDISATPISENLSRYVRSTAGTHIITGNAGTIGRSTDGINFTYTRLTDAQDLFAATAGAGKIVATGQNEIWLSTDDGLTWKKVFKTFTGLDTAGVLPLADVAFDGTTFVAVSQSGRTWRSTDGAKWVDGERIRYGSAFPAVRAMEFGGGRFTAVGSVSVPNGSGFVTRSAVFSSTNGKDWVQSFVGSTSNQYRSVAFGNGRWIAGGTSGRIARSLDGGQTWAELFSGSTTDTFFGAGFGGSTYALVGANGRIATSADAVTWSFQTASDTTPSFFDASGNGSVLYLIGSAGTVYTMTGTTPTRIDTNSSVLATANRSTAFEEAVVLNNKLFVGGSDGAVYESTDGASYTRRPTTTTNALFSLTLHNNVIFAAGTGGVIVSSPDGTNWTTRTSNTTQQLLKIASVNGQLIALGVSGTLLTSSNDGVTWTVRTSNTTANLRSVAFGDGLFVIGTDALFNAATGQFEGAVLTSPNGVTWTRLVIRSSTTSAAQPAVRGILRRDNHFLLFLGDGSVLRSSFNNGSLSIQQVADGLGIQTAAFEAGGVIYSLTARANDEIHSTLNYSLDEETWVRTEIPTSVGAFGSTVFGNQIYYFANFNFIKRSSTLVAQPRAPVALTAAAQTVGIGGSIGLGVPFESSEELTYQWSFNGNAIVGATAPALNLNNVQAGQSGTYTLTATGTTTGTVVAGTVTLNVVAAAPFITRQPANTQVSAGERAVLSVEATGTSPLTFAWFKNGAVISGATASVLTIPSANSGDAGVYRVEVTNASGTTVSLDATISLAANVPGFWRTATEGATSNFSPARTVHDGQGRIYTAFSVFAQPLDVVGNQLKGSLVRLIESTGAIDPSFVWDDRLGNANFVEVLPNGQLLVAVSLGLREGSTVIRLNADGSRDNTFSAPIYDRGIRFITRQSDDKILVAATDNQSSVTPSGTIVTTGPSIVRLNSDGSLDNGFATVVLSSAGAFLAAPPVVDSSGRVYLAGGFSQINGTTTRITIARVNSAGVLDPDFGNLSNTAQLPAGYASNQARGVFIQSDGKVVFVGDFRYTARGTGGDPIMAIRFNNDATGTFDNSYVQPLRSQLPMNPSLGQRLRYVVGQSDDKIVVVSDSIFRLNANGSFDSSFQSRSFSKETFWVSRSPSTGNFFVADLAPQDVRGGIGAFTSNGASIDSFNSGGWGNTSAPGTAFALADGRVIAGGNFNHFATSNVTGAALFGPAGNFVADPTPFYHPNDGRINPLTQITGWSDGSFVVRETDFGNATNGAGSRVSTRRYNADGSESAAWNFPETGPNGNEVITATEPGKLVVWLGALGDQSLVTSGPGAWMRRFNADGSQDFSFEPDLSSLFSIVRNGSNIITSVNVGRIMQVRALLDGSMLLAVVDSSQNVRVLKMLPSGAIDGTYTSGILFAGNANGPVTRTTGNNIFDPVTGTNAAYTANTFFSATFADFVALPDSSSFITGGFQISGQPFGIARLLPNGSADTAFTGAGLSFSGLLPAVPFGVSLGLDDSGRVYLSGRFSSVLGSSALGLARFSPAGVLDSSFAPGSGIEIRSDRLVNSMLVGKAGRLHVLGAGATVGAPSPAGYVSVPIADGAPIILGQSATSQSLVSGQNLQLFAGAFGGANGTMQWSHNGQPIIGATGPVLFIPGATTLNAGTYTFTVSNGAGSPASISTITVSVSDAPVITRQPQGGSVNTGGSITLNVEAAGAAPLSFQWKKDTVDIGGATSSSFTINNAQAGDAASYTVVVTNSVTSVTSDPAVVTVNAAPVGPTIVLQPVSQTVVSGYTTILSVAASGSGNTTQWFRDGVLQTSGIGTASTLLSDGSTVTASTLTVTNPTVTTTFLANVTGSNGAVTGSNIATLTPEAGYNFSTIAGNFSPGSNDGTGTGARFRTPLGSAVDGSGNVYVADSGNHIIRKITSGGVVTTLAGLAGTSGTADGTGNAARFNTPTGIALASDGNLYVTEGNSQTIRKVTTAGVVTTLAGLANTAGSTDGTGTGARFNNPRAIAFAANDGNLYVVEGQSTVRKVTLGGVVTTFAGLALNNGSTDATGTSARFNFPNGIAAFGSNLFIADSSNSVIRQVTIPGAVVTTLAGAAGQFSTTDGNGATARFNFPKGIAAASDGTLFIADTNSQTIRRIASGTADVTTVLGTIFQTGSTDGVGSAARFNSPQALSTDSSGNLFISDSTNNTIRKVVISTLTSSTFAGVAPGSNDGTGTGAKFFQPLGLARDSSGNLYVADTISHTIRKITPANVVTTFAGIAGTNGTADGTGTAAAFSNPQALAIDAANNLLFVADGNHTIRQVDLANAAVTTIAGGANFQSGLADGNGTNARFNFPGGIVFDSTTNSLYVADTNNHAIRRVFLASVVSPFVRGDVITVAGTNSSGNTNGTGTAARFNFPRGIAVDASGNVFLADANNSTIRKVVPGSAANAGVATTFAGANSSFSVTDGAGTTARFNAPRGLVFDPTSQNFFVTETGNVVRRMTATGAVTTLAGGVNVPNSVDSSGAAARFSFPNQITVDSAGILYVADTQNSTIRRGFNAATLAITTQPVAQTVATGSTVNFTVVATGSSLTFQWKKNGTDISGQTSSTLTLTNVQSGDAANYSVSVTNSSGTITSNSVALTVANQAANDNFASAMEFVGLTGTNTTANTVATGESGEPTNFSNNATNSSLWYKWTPVVSGVATIDTFGSITGTSGTTPQDTALSVYTGTSLADLSFVAANNDADGTLQSKVTIPVTAGVSYFIQAGTNTGSRGNIVLNFSVAVLPTPASSAVVAGSPASFAITLDGAQSTFGAQWSRNGSDIGGATSATFNIPSATGANAGVYLAGITQSANPADYTFSQPAYLLVGDAGSTTQIDRFDGLAISNNWLPNPLIFLPSTEAGFSVSDQLQFTTASAPFNPIDRALQNATNLPLDRDWSVVTRIGLGTQAQFAGISGSGSTRKAGASLGVFSPNNSLDALTVGARISNNGSGTVVRELFTDVDQAGTSTPTSITLGATQLSSLVRLDYNAFSGQVTASVAGASGFAPSTSVNVISAWGLDRSQSLRIVLRAFSTRMPVTPGTVFADDFGLVIFPGIITAQPASQTVSIGGNASLSVTATGATGFQWFRNGATVSGATAATLNLTNVTGADAGAYTVQVTTANGSTTSATANLTVSQFEITTPPGPTTVAAGSPASFTVATSGTSALTFQWARNGVAISSGVNASAITAVLNIAAAQTTDEGYYTVTISDGSTTITTRPALLALTDDPNVLRLAASQPTAEFKFEAAPSRVYVDGRGGLIVTDFFQFFSANNAGGNRLDGVLRLDVNTGAPDLNYARTPQLAYSAAAAPQPDGTVIVVGSTENDLDLPQSRFRLFRYRTDGTLDPNYHGAFLSNFVRFITRMPDGRLLLAASVATGPTSTEPGAVNISVINRFLPDGTRDSTFTAPTLNAGGFLFAEPRLDSQGRIIIAGSFTSVNGHATNNVARLLANGAVDTSFVTSGFTPDTAQGIRTAVPVAGDKILIGGRRLNIGGTRFVVARLNANGSLDSTFTLVQPTTFGFTTNGTNNNTRYITTIPGGRFYTATENQIIRFFDDGSVDPNFNRVVAPQGAFLGTHVFTQLAALDDGTLFTTIDVPVTQGNVSRNSVIRINPNGSIDPTFTAPEFAHEVFPSIALAKADGSLIVGGQSFSRVGTAVKGGLARILANGTLDPSFNVTVPDGFDTFASGGLTSTGQIYALAFGVTRDNNLDQVFTSGIFRYNADGSHDGAFVAPSADLTGASLVVQGDLPYVFRNTVEDLQSGEPLAVRLDASGGVDGTFNVSVGLQGAFTSVSPFNAALAPFTPIASLPAGGFLMVAANGPFTATQTSFDVTLKKLKLDGTFDSAFTGPVIVGVPSVAGGDGTTSNFYNTTSVAYAPFTAATALANGTFLIAGRTSSYGGVNAPAGVALLDATGAPSATFSANLGTGPQLLGSANSFARIDKFLVQTSGKIIVTGSFDTWNGKPVPGIVRLNADGTLDPAFYSAVSYYNYLPTTTDLVSAGGNTFWLLGQYRRGVDGWPFAINRVEFPPAPGIGTDPVDTTVVFRGNTSFAVAPSGIGPFTFQWQKNGQDIVGATNSTLPITNAQFSDAGSYRVLIGNANGTTPSASATLTVIDGFEAYRTANFDSNERENLAVSGPDAIFGFDGLTNLVKYALGLPAKPDAQLGLPVLTNDGTDWIFTFTRPKTTTDLEYLVEVNPDLTNPGGWTNTGVSALELVSSTSTTETMRARFAAAGNPNLFVRLRVTHFGNDPR